MRRWSLLLILLLMIASTCLGQITARPLPPDPRPFGKYLVEVCTIQGPRRTVTCNQLLPFPPAAGGAAPAAAQLRDQTITLKQVCDPDAKDGCELSSPKVGNDFFVSATSDSGLPVQQNAPAPAVVPVSNSRGITHYHANVAGPLIIRATADGNPTYAAAAPVDLILQVSDAAEKSPSPCLVLPSSSPAPTTLLDATVIVPLLGNPTPFIITAQGPNTIVIYATRRPPLLPAETTTLNSFRNAIIQFAGRTAASLGLNTSTPKPFSVELKIPHASALGDLATRIGSLNYSQFTVQDVGRGFIRVNATSQPDCDTWKSFLSDIRSMAWQAVSAPMSTKLFYLSSSDVATAFTSLAPAASGGASSSTSTAGGSASSSSAPSAGVGSATPSTAASASVGSNATITLTQPAGSNIQINSDTTPCVVAGLASSNANPCGMPPSSASTSATSSTSASPAVTTPAPAPIGMASVAVAAGTGEQTPPDLLVYSDANPGDDAQIAERNRIIAQLDLPRPEMILSAWVTQNSTANPQAMGAFNNMVKHIVVDYNDEYENVILNGWFSLKDQQAKDPNYFNEPFRSYISDRFVADTNKERKTDGAVQELSQAFLDQSQAKMADPISPGDRSGLGICERGHYCLGYTGLFKHGLSHSEDSNSDPNSDNPSPIRPTLTDILFAIIAADHPVEAAIGAIQKIEGNAKPVPPCGDCICDDKTLYQLEEECTGAGKSCKAYSHLELKLKENEVRKRCHAIWRNLDLDHVSLAPQSHNCEELDFRGILGSLLDAETHEPRIHLECFKKEAARLLANACKPNQTESECNAEDLSILGFDAMKSEATNSYRRAVKNDYSTARKNPPYGVGLYRAAIADFLFNYKMSQQYPHEFVAYDLTQSANNLNNALSPLIDAFNRDLWSYQMFVRADMQYQVEQLNSRTDERCCVKKLFGIDKPSFFNDGLVTVRTISGQPTSVSVTSQSFLNGSTAPELSALLGSLSASTSSGSGSNSNGVPPVLGGNFGMVASALANYQTSFAQIGRQLSFTATPRSLATASSAEIAVTLNADESAGSPLYTGPGATDPAFNTSRVANHDTTTRVRVDSIKLFEVSSFSAIVERSRSRFPLLPPFVEIPYIGTFAGIPLGSAKEFHSSTAIISAYVIPTAADIAYGLHFVSDLMVDGLNPGPCSFFKSAAGPDVKNACVFRKMFSLQDVGEQQPVREFNKNITRCFATDTSSDGCRRISFDNALESHN